MGFSKVVVQSWIGRASTRLRSTPSLTGAPRDQLRKELTWAGYGTLAAGVLAHPSADSEALLDILQEAGAHDKVGRPEGMRKLVDLIPDARFVCIDDAGHYAFAEQQDVFVSHVVGFVREVAQRRAAA